MLDYLGRKKPVRFKRCVLHIGTEKTGTSTIQAFLSQNRGLLADEGVLYPAFGGGKNGGSQWGFAACAARQAWKLDIGRFLNIQNEEEQKRYRADLIETFNRDARALSDRQLLVISCEHFQSRLRHVDEIAALKGFLSHWVDDFHIVLYLRRQDRMAMSLYSTKVKSGNPSPVLFNNLKPGRLPYYYDYETLYRQWTEVFGADAITVRLLDPSDLVGGDLLQDFSAVSGISLDGRYMPDRINESLSQEGVDFLLEVNRQLPKADEDEATDAFRQKISSRTSLLCKGHPAGIARARAEAFYEHFRESNERLKELVFPDREAPLFDDDFDGYNHEAVDAEPRYEDAVRLAIRLLEGGNG